MSSARNGELPAVRGAGVVRDYLLLALRLDRLRPGSVGGGTGVGALRALVRDEPAPSAPALVRAAGRLVGELPAVGLAPERERFLAAQLAALECTARRLVGQAVPFVQEVRSVFDTDTALGSQDRYRAAHRSLDALLPGRGPLAPRWAAHRRADEVRPDRLLPAVRALSGAFRERVRGAGLLTGPEAVEYAVVQDAPWSALHQYLGSNRSRITINAGARPRRMQLAQLVAHEAYPGHHTERCRKDAGLVAAGWDEHRVVVTNSPQALIAEGAAELGLRAVIGPGWGRTAAQVLGELGLAFDGDLAERVEGVGAVLARVRQDAALLLHAHGAPSVEVLAHLRRWMLVDDVRARQVLQFLRHPLWRAYTATYVEGAALLERWWERDPRPERFRRLVDEPLTPAAVRAELAEPGPNGRPPSGAGPPMGRDGR